jgi:predicted MFS family arabinose efflux permease
MLVATLLMTIHKLTQTNLAMSIPMFSFGLSAIIFGILAGVYVDRWSKKKILWISNFLRGALILIFVLVPETRHDLWAIFSLSFLVFTIAQYFIPAEASCIPLTVGKEDLLTANSFYMGTWMGVTVLGFGLTSFLSLSGISLVWIYLMTALLYAAAGVLTLLFNVAERPTTKIHTLMSTLRDFSMSFSYAFRNRLLRYSLLKVFLATSVLAVLSELAIDFVRKILHQPYDTFGFYIAFSGVGMAASMFFLPRMKHIPKTWMTSIGFTICGTMLILMTTTQSIPLVLFYIFMLGFGNGYITVPIQTSIQENTLAQMHGRVFALQNVVISAAFTVPVVLAGYLADRYPVGILFAGMGGIILLSTVLIELRILFVPIEGKLRKYRRLK